MSIESSTVSVRCGGSPFIHLFLNTSEEAQVTKQKALKVEGLGMHVFLATQENKTI